MALFGVPLAHEDHAVRACYAALAMREAIQCDAEEVRRNHGVELQIRVGVNSGEVVARAIGNDLTMDYAAIGQTIFRPRPTGTRRLPSMSSSTNSATSSSSSSTKSVISDASPRAMKSVPPTISP